MKNCLCLFYLKKPTLKICISNWKIHSFVSNLPGRILTIPTRVLSVWSHPLITYTVPSLTTCVIDHQTIPRPANTWISAHTINNSHFYHVSLHCPFDYCLPHSSQLNLSTPDSQCQFNRTGVVCGQCQHGLSTVFGCKQCSNVYLLLLIPVSVAGILLIACMIGFNITKTKDNIAGVSLYVNILSINTSTIVSHENITIKSIVVFANFDLGIETCFYNGMDDYTKTWLQLAFPVYLIFFATLLIITSRYSTTIQRFTARRTLPILATLFLLFYTKLHQMSCFPTPQSLTYPVITLH